MIDDLSPNVAVKLREAEAELERLRKRVADLERSFSVRESLAVLEAERAASRAEAKRRQAERARLTEQSRRRSSWSAFLDSFFDD